MANPLLSPGVQTQVTDQTAVPVLPPQTGLCLVGPTVTGPVNIPTVVNSYQQFQALFGTSFISGSSQYEYLTNIAASNYFSQGGANTSLLMVRVASGSYTEASSSFVYNSVNSSLTASVAIPIMMNISGSVTGYLDGDFDDTFSYVGDLTGSCNLVYLTSSNSLYFYSGIISGSFEDGYIDGRTTPVSGTLSGSFIGYSNVGPNVLGSSVFVLNTFKTGVTQNDDGPKTPNGAFVSGSNQNVKWEVISPNVSTGTFGLLVRRGDDTDANKIILETYPVLSLDPLSPNYIEAVIGNQSKEVVLDESTGNYYVETLGTYANASNYVYVSKVNYTTPNYFDNNNQPKPQYTGSLPIGSNGGFGGATGNDTATAINFYDEINSSTTTSGEGITQGLTADNYQVAVNILQNKDDYKFILLATPGLVLESNSVVNSFINLAQSRIDTYYILDLVNYGSTVNNVINKANSITLTYGETEWPWIQTLGVETGKQVWVPTSTLIPGQIAYSDSISQPWFAAAGLTRGLLPTAIQAERRLQQSDRDNLYQANVNPIATFNPGGITKFGQKTLLKVNSALNRGNVVRMVLTISRVISNFALTFVFEQNDIQTQQALTNLISPYLDSVRQQQGITAYRIQYQDSSNANVDRNTLIGLITIQPTYALEFIYLNFVVTPSIGASVTVSGQ